MTDIAHGGALDAAIARFGGVRSDWLDLSTGINPVAYPFATIPSELWQNLPDQSLFEACAFAARSYYGVSTTIAGVIAPGTQSIIQCLPQLIPDAAVHVMTPCYGEYAHVFGSRAIGCDDPGDAKQVLVVVNPNNPDGRIFTLQEIQACLERGVRVIIDEAFCDVVPDASLVELAERPGVLVLKSLGKFFGLAGLRLGFAFGDRDLVEAIRARLGPWAVSGPGLHIGRIAMEDGAWIDQTRHRLVENRKRLQTLLLDSGFSTVASTDLFVTVARDDALNICEKLAREHILVRAFDYAPTWLRFGLPANDQAFCRLKDVLQP